jgi:hypothetical protein
LLGSNNWKLLEVMVVGSIAVLKLALRLETMENPLVAFGGAVAVTVGDVVDPWGT